MSDPLPEQLDDDELVLNTPVGYWHLMLMAAYAKRGLQFKMSAGKRLKLLELLNSLTDGYFTPDMLAIIEPMCDTQMEMVNEARSLDGEDDRLLTAACYCRLPQRVHRTDLDSLWAKAYHGFRPPLAAEKVE